MRIKLISASVYKGTRDLVHYPRVPNRIMFPSLGLLVIAAVTGREHEVQLINDEVENIDYSDPVDLVGISYLTPASIRAYEIADNYRKQGITVIMGGVHASALPEEAGEHCDSVVIGEGENLWPQLLEDFTSNNLKKFYRNEGFVDIDSVPFARRDLLVRKQYITTNIIQASRGCPYKCEFCSVSEMFGTKTRLRSVDKVIDEIKGLDGNAIIFADDNLAINIDYSKELFSRMIPMKRKWTGEASWTIANYPELLDIMKQSGCVGLLIGFESIRPQDNIKKISNQKTMTELFVEAIDKIHERGLIVFGTFIFGFDNDDERVFRETMEFINKADIEYVSVAPLVPYPGTPLYRRLLSENRVVVKDWRNYIYNPPGVCFEPKNLTSNQLRDNLRMMYLEAYSYRRLLMLTFRMLKRYRNLIVAVRLFIIGVALRKRTQFRWQEPQDNKL